MSLPWWLRLKDGEDGEDGEDGAGWTAPSGPPSVDCRPIRVRASEVGPAGTAWDIQVLTCWDAGRGAASLGRPAPSDMAERCERGASAGTRSPRGVYQQNKEATASGDA
ncbi:hypothetical protein TPA0910_81620 [Streptomyces hygroscopicus subsp. sporocinereus]|uniref:Uncharacterized protein n=1 Tax=Streptomyces hygroscopicus TaxID=1912 RepID=A0ABQ3UDQ2_STRHY|nr:hypothetical protein TPA0910_81620 [Streptomyces hygroscopicus]